VSKPKPPVRVVERKALVRRTTSEVFRFFDQPSNLKRVFPSGLAVSLERHPDDLRPGTLFGYRLKRWPLDFHWEAVVSDYRPPGRFTSVKSRGYFPRWVLEHEILAQGADSSHSELCMRLSYEVPSGIYSAFTYSYVIREAMEELIEAQIRAIREALESR
jgi:ligand-binding SRPBCC domain-containing protein